MEPPSDKCVFELNDAMGYQLFLEQAYHTYGRGPDGLPNGPICDCRKCRSMYRRKIEPKRKVPGPDSDYWDGPELFLVTMFREKVADIRFPNPEPVQIRMPHTHIIVNGRTCQVCDLRIEDL